jgi:hypothetical protein
VKSILSGKGANHVADARWNVGEVGCEADL